MLEAKNLNIGLTTETVLRISTNKKFLNKNILQPGVFSDKQAYNFFAIRLRILISFLIDKDNGYTLYN